MPWLKFERTSAGQAPQPAIGGSGPKPSQPTATASYGSWKPSLPPGKNLPPPSYTGMGRQIQINSATEFCLLMPPDPTTQNLVDAEANAVSYCLKPYNDTRPMPDGFIKTAHFRKTSKYVQISGTYDPRKMNLSPNDCGGEYDNHGALGVGNPVGAAVDGAKDFMQFMGGCDIPGNAVFCLRACHGDDSYEYCKNTFDLMGCLWVMPGDYETPGFTDCEANPDLPVGVYPVNGTPTVSAFHQGASPTPPPVNAPASSQCVKTASPAPSGASYYWDSSNNLTNSKQNSTTNAANGSTSKEAKKSGSFTIKFKSKKIFTVLIAFISYLSCV
ncbi:hypothetical protein BY996DRAFT_6413811 [Phakopsora pachyrhizi]|nr:hypothetical protein BY996DRAFT_6413811 [Phakopsora pachyrhizi]